VTALRLFALGFVAFGLVPLAAAYVIAGARRYADRPVPTYAEGRLTDATRTARRNRRLTPPAPTN
jgi:hypothetical protein